MSRRNGSILDDLAKLPWWTNVILAVVVYLTFKFVVLSIASNNPFLEGISGATPTFAPIVSILLLTAAVIPAFCA